MGSETLKLLQEKLEVIGIDNYFLNRTPAAQELRTRINNWDHVKTKISVQQRKQLLDSRENPQTERKFLLGIQWIKEVSRICKEFKK
jgi:hypothetical protein